MSVPVFAPTGMTASGMNPGPRATRAVGKTTLPALVADASANRGGKMILGGTPPSGGAEKMILIPPPGGGLTQMPTGPLRDAPEAALPGGPAGGGYSTAADLQRFFAALRDGGLVSGVTMSALVSRQIVAAPASAAGPERDYGLGFGIGDFEGHAWYGHNGGAPGVNTEIFAFPADHATLIVLSDRDPPVASTLFRKMRALLFNPQLCKSDQ